MSAKKSKKKTQQLNKQTKSTPSYWSWILPLVIIGICAIIFLQSGLVGSFLNQLLSLLFGQWFLVLVGAIMLFCAIKLLIKDENPFTLGQLLAYLCLVIAFLLISSMNFGKEQLDIDAFGYIGMHFNEMFNQSVPSYGGLLGLSLYGLVETLVGNEGLLIVICILFIISGALLSFSTYWQAVWHQLRDSFTLPSLYGVEDDEEMDPQPISEPRLKQAPVEIESIMNEDQMIEEKQVTYLNPDTQATPKAIYIDANEDIVADNVHTSENNCDDVDDNVVYDDLTILTHASKKTVPSKVAHSSFFIDVDPIEDDFNDDAMCEPFVTSEPANLSFMVNHETDIETAVISNDTSVEHSGETSISVTPSYQPGSTTTQVGDTTFTSQPASNSIGATIARLAIEKRNQESERIKPPSDGPYKIPPVSLLESVNASKKSDANLKAARIKGSKLVDCLNTFGINTQLVATHIGPAVTKFEVRPEANVKVSKISNLSDNIKMELQARQLRIEAPIPGHNAVGVEIPNEESTMVKMKEVILSEPMRKDDSPLLFALGKNLFGEAVSVRLDKMPHLLIAGATGSGKSVCMNAIITSLLLRAHPDDLKLLLIDPKKVEFTPYHDIPHLIGPVINDPNQANTALKAIVKEMDDRYNLFSLAGVRKLDDFNQLAKKDKSLQPLPYIVVIIDELADLMVVAGKDVESSIQRITQLARAAGIHLIVATQRPSTDVITGIIKSNIPSRIAFAVSSSIDSRTILDHSGAERLLGYGDMLYVPMGEQTPIRVQGVYVSDNEVNQICEYAKKQRSPRYADAFIRLEGVDGNEGTAVSTIEADPMFMEAKNYVIQVQKASTSLLQRRFQIGYNRAARIIEALEENGVIGPAQGSKPREVYVQNDA